MFTKGKVKLDVALYSQAVERAAKLGYSSVDEWVTHLLERELKKDQMVSSKESVLHKMKGLGYLK